jgi:hypothetical protein
MGGSGVPVCWYFNLELLSNRKNVKKSVWKTVCKNLQDVQQGGRS